MKKIAWGLVVCAAIAGCKKQGDKGAADPGSAVGSAVGSDAVGGMPPPVPPPAPAMAPEARARAFLQGQLDAGSDLAKLRQTFAPGATVLTEGDVGPAAEVQMFGLGDDGPGGAQVKSTKIGKLVAGGNSEAVWFYAEVAVEGGAGGTTRAVELLAAPDWHAVAASFGRGSAFRGAGKNIEIPGATSADGPLAKLLGSASAVSAALAPDAIVVGPGQMAAGAAGKDAIASWKLDSISLSGKARELRKSRWGFVQASLDRVRPEDQGTDRIVGQLFAVSKPDGTWTVVLAQYAAR